ncbi:hypothetical protein RZN05_20090 [Sphingomonas sp. HF-S4]|uniref:Argininosuccinate lyase n=1 Tax=Sphingomonas agrestis TaxID=3080540 RepID=A0ABU3YD32_9SPHN|nr:hypothetical protein [Sphingomonas sp. HF-S4]MDV3459305.1 hypothetical protein [Sphingomonas sp. HF-S4]
MIKGLPLLAIALALAGCGGSDDSSASRDEARQLDEAAAATDINASLADNGTQP